MNINSIIDEDHLRLRGILYTAVNFMRIIHQLPGDADQRLAYIQTHGTRILRELEFGQKILDGMVVDI